MYIYNMKLTIVIPTRGDKNMQNSIKCLQKQTFKDFEAIFVVDRLIINDEKRVKDRRIHYITNINSDFISKQNASYNRNFGIKQAKGEYILLMDDDEWFEESYLENYLVLRDEYRKKLAKDFVLVPTLMYRKTGHIQSQWFSHFNYLLSRPIPQVLWNKSRDYIQMYSWNSLLAPAYIFKEYPFDEEMDFVYEDLDFSYSIHRAWYPIIVLRDLKIYHMERDKTALEHLWIGNEHSAYKKFKHKMMFIKKNASTVDLIVFYIFGFLWHPMWLTLYLLKYPFKTHTFVIIKSIRKGVFYKHSIK